MKKSFLFAMLSVASVAGAQQPATGIGVVIGIAIDSLHGRPLREAEVMLQGAANRTTTTDAKGEFRIDSLPPGHYQLGIFHPLLDSLGLTLATAPFDLGPDSASVVRLAIPSAVTLVARTCRARVRTLGPAAIFGRLLDPETEQPVPHADVSIVWTQFDASLTAGVHQTPRLIRDSTDVNGVFRLCGLPTDLEARLQANLNGATTADVLTRISPDDGNFVTRTLYVSPADTGATKTGKAVVTGRVSLVGGAPAAGTRVEILGSNAVAMTNERGEFTLANAPSGTQLLMVRRLGYTPSETPVNLSSRQPQTVAVRLEKYIPVMAPVLVTARRDRALQDVGFVQRQKSGMGHYITADQIARRSAFQLTDILRTVPGLTMTTVNGQTEISSTRSTGTSGSCTRFVVDGFPWTSVSGSGDVNDFVNPREVSAIEVYQAEETPAEFMQAGQQCTTIVIWTKTKIGS
jgi:hypothetical protein